MGFFKEFKTFVQRGNVVDMAVGIVIGGAFGKIVSSFVADIIMPPIGLLLGNVNFSELNCVLRSAEVIDGVEKAAVTVNYGSFLQTLVDFIVIALAIFMVIRAMNNMKKKEEEEAPAPAAAPAPSKEEVLLSEIRDILKDKK